MDARGFPEGMAERLRRCFRFGFAAFAGYCGNFTLASANPLKANVALFFRLQLDFLRTCTLSQPSTSDRFGLLRFVRVLKARAYNLNQPQLVR
jgi:hypothetical protein